MNSAKNTTKQEKATKQAPIVVAQIMGKMNGGGVEAVIMNYYRHIDRSKVQFDFICDEDSTNIPYEEIEKLGGKVILCPPYQKLRKYMKFLEKLFREKKYRIVHSNINTLSVFPLKAAKKAGVPVRIAHSHSTGSPKEFKKNVVKNMLRPFSRKYATDYFACGEAAGRFQFGRRAFRNGKVIIIPNAVEVQKFKYDELARKRIRQELKIGDDDFVMGHVGRFVTVKNHDFLVEVFAETQKEIANSKLLLVGQGPLEHKIKEKVDELGLSGKIIFTGQRNDTDKIYSALDVFCLPSLYEGFPVVCVEAQVNGVRTLLSDRISKESVINDTAKQINIDAIRSWVDEITKDHSCDRDSFAVDNMYDISTQAPILIDYYEARICGR